MMLTTRSASSAMGVYGLRPSAAKQRLSARSIRIGSKRTIRPSRLMIDVGSAIVHLDAVEHADASLGKPEVELSGRRDAVVSVGGMDGLRIRSVHPCTYPNILSLARATCSG